MKLYRVSYYSNKESSQGFEFFTSMRKATKALNTFKKLDVDDFDEGRSGIKTLVFHPTKEGILGLLFEYATHNDNG